MNTTGTSNFTWPSATQPQGRGGAETKAVKGATAAGHADSVADTSKPALETDSADATEDRFLKLLVAQMRNQDPLNPLDNAQVTTQLAQISTVRGIEGLNRTMGNFVTSQGSAAASVGMLGRQVLVPGEVFAWQPPADGGPTRIGFELSEPATALRLELIDKSGKVVHAWLVEADVDVGRLASVSSFSEAAGCSSACGDLLVVEMPAGGAGRVSVPVTAADLPFSLSFTRVPEGVSMGSCSRAVTSDRVAGVLHTTTS